MAQPLAVGVMAQAWRACSPKPAAEAQRHEHEVRTNRLGCFLGFCFFSDLAKMRLVSSAIETSLVFLSASALARVYI